MREDRKILKKKILFQWLLQVKWLEDNRFDKKYHFWKNVFKNMLKYDKNNHTDIFLYLLF